MKYKDLCSLVEKFTKEESIGDNDIQTLIAVFSIGRDGFFVNGSAMYNLSNKEFEEIHIKYLSDQAFSEEERRSKLKEELLGNAYPVETVIKNIEKDITMNEKDSFKSKNKSQILKYLAKGLATLQEFPEQIK